MLGPAVGTQFVYFVGDGGLNLDRLIADALRRIAGVAIDATRWDDLAYSTQHQLDAAVRAEREKARDQLEKAATDFAASFVQGDGSEPGWSSRMTAGLEAIRRSLGVAEEPEESSSVAEEVDRLRGELDALQAILERCPA